MIVSTISEKVDKSDVESISSETIKDESGLSLSRAYSVTSEPPAYKKPTSSSVRIARLIAVTVVAVALILGTAIILAAYLQTRHGAPSHFVAAPASSTETNKAVTAALPSALTGDSPNGVGESSSSESSSEVPDDEKDHRRLDTDSDLLEEFLENEGKILRLPTGSDLDIDIDELTKMFMKRNPLDKSKCVVERRPIDGADDFVKVLPITAKNATAVPLMPVVSGERISIICSSDETELDLDDDLIQSRPISPFGMRPPGLRIHPFGSIGPINSMSVIGPIPLMMNGHMMNPGSMMLPRTMRPALPLGLTPPPFDLNNALLLEQRAFNVPPPHMRSPFQPFQPRRPFPGQMHQMNPNPFPQQFQSFPPPRPLDIPTEKRFNFPSDLSDNSQEKSHVPEHRMNADPEILVSTQRTPIFRERQPSPILPDFPEGLLGLLEDLPDILGEEPKPEQRLSVPPEQPELPTFRIPKFLLNTPGPNVRQHSAPAGPVQQLTGPVTLPFLQVPPLPAALAKERSAPTPVNIPFLNVRSTVTPPTPARPTLVADRRQGRSFFERLMDSVLSSNNNRAPKNLPIETRPAPPAIRTGGRGLRMPEERQDLPDGIIAARPIESVDDSIAPEQDRRARSHHFIQPRSLKVN